MAQTIILVKLSSPAFLASVPRFTYAPPVDQPFVLHIMLRSASRTGFLPPSLYSLRESMRWRFGW